MLEILTTGLLSFLVIVFLGYAGVIWTLVDDIRTDVHNIQQTLQGVAVQLDNIKESQTRHEGIDWHARAGEEISSIRSEVKQIRADHDRMRDRDKTTPYPFNYDPR